MTLAPMDMALAPDTADAPGLGGTRTILCVDDEPNIVRALQRLLRTTGHQILTATSGDEALRLLGQSRVDLIISDLNMPGMSGTVLMQQVCAQWPEVTRLLLTGHADLSAAIAAINQGQVSRYLSKPWNDQELTHTIDELLQRKDLEEEKRRLEALTLQQNEELKGLIGKLDRLVLSRTQQLEQANERLRSNHLKAIKTFSQLVDLRVGHAAGHGPRVAELSLQIAQALHRTPSECQDIVVAGLLHDVGQIGLPDALIQQPHASLNEADAARFRQHTVVAEQILSRLDDMRMVVAMIRGHHERFDGTGYPDGLQGRDIPMGAQILAVADTYDELQTGQAMAAPLTPQAAREAMVRGRGTAFAPEVLDAFLSVLDGGTAPEPESQSG
jgi:response regulator RpfG family c-di-GMP phosphodiesterase